MTDKTNPFAGIPCRDCGDAVLRLEYRTTLVAKPLGTWSLAGVQDKRSAVEIDWPWCVCDSCKAECKGKR